MTESINEVPQIDGTTKNLVYCAVSVDEINGNDTNQTKFTTPVAQIRPVSQSPCVRQREEENDTFASSSVCHQALEQYKNELANEERNARAVDTMLIDLHTMRAQQLIDTAQARCRRLSHGMQQVGMDYPHIDQLRSNDMDIELFLVVGRDEAASKVRMLRERELLIYVDECMTITATAAATMVKLVRDAEHIVKAMNTLHISNVSVDAARSYRMAIQKYADQFRMVDDAVSNQLRNFKSKHSAIAYVKEFCNALKCDERMHVKQNESEDNSDAATTSSDDPDDESSSDE